MSEVIESALVKAKRTEQVLLWVSRISYLIMLCVYLFVCYFILSDNPKPAGFLFLFFFGYLLYPMKHPCDYRNYSEWWADRKNWRK